MMPREAIRSYEIEDLRTHVCWKARLVPNFCLSQEEHQKEIKSLQAIVEQLKSDQEEAKLRLVRKILTVLRLNYVW